ncbi:MAG: UDP-N-acetylglucosamine 4,6-dehydratase/5-epimerase [Desulfovibrionales bacterium]|nr:UDP-N-acetylglucosamine 4,6-dehydratase/5-epimerase [Desulfovibrionales bacterium]
MLNGKTLLITGGTGSFGKACTKILLERYDLAKLIIFSRDEQKQYEMAQQFPMKSSPIRYFIGDVRDKERLQRAFRGVDYVIHAAAMKHVPASEYNPTEAIKTNVHGAQNIVNVASDVGVQRVVALSTDKAVSPVNLYGATKLCSDKLFVAANAFTANDACRYSVVRYGNVMGSRGSVIPFFIRQRAKGVLPITDPRMTRFWITLEAGVEQVLWALQNMKGGEIVVPKLPSMRITDLAEAVAPGCKTEVVGIRPGEKLHEAMIAKADARNTVDMGKYYLILPDTGFVELECNHDCGTPVPEEFEYNSRDNDWWLGVDEMREVLRYQGWDI